MFQKQHELNSYFKLMNECRGVASIFEWGVQFLNF